jgi:Putative adhesin
MPRRSPIRLNMLNVNMLHKTIIVCLMLTSFCAASDWNYEESHSEVRDFTTGGTVHVRLRVGDLHIRRGDVDKIRLHYTVKSWRESHVKDAHVEIDVHGRDADIEFYAPSSGNTQFDVELEVPENTNLEVHEKVGDLRIDGIDGDKDLGLGVGDIRVTLGHSAYHLVRASTSIGDVNTSSGDVSAGFLGKTLRYYGDGKYELRAHVGIGDISLEGK